MSDVLTPAASTQSCQGALGGTGKFIWYELMTSDQDAAIAFYEAVVGWNSEDQKMADMGNFRYTILSAGDHGVGGLMQLTDDMRAAGARPGWLGYIGVSDTDAAAKNIVEAGGTIHMGPDDIPNVGRFAMVADPAGAVFYIMTPAPQGEGPPPPDPTATGLVSWRELYSSLGQEAAFAFYAGQFGWETLDEMDMGPMGKYRIFGADGMQMGGMMDKPENIPASSWAYYINVDGIDAAIGRINAQGGTVLMGPQEVPGGSWIVQAADPQGAGFALVSATR